MKNFEITCPCCEATIVVAKRFDRQLESQKDRARILEEKFKAALEQAEKSDEKYVNPMDYD